MAALYSFACCNASPCVICNIVGSSHILIPFLFKPAAFSVCSTSLRICWPRCLMQCCSVKCSLREIAISTKRSSRCIPPSCSFRSYKEVAPCTSLTLLYCSVLVTLVFAAVNTHQTTPQHRAQSRKAASTSLFLNFPSTAFLLAAPTKTGSGCDSSWVSSPAAALSSCSLVLVQAFEITRLWGGFLFRGCAYGSRLRGGVSPIRFHSFI